MDYESARALFVVSLKRGIKRQMPNLQLGVNIHQYSRRSHHLPPEKNSRYTQSLNNYRKPYTDLQITISVINLAHAHCPSGPQGTVTRGPNTETLIIDVAVG